MKKLKHLKPVGDQSWERERFSGLRVLKQLLNLMDPQFNKVVHRDEIASWRSYIAEFSNCNNKNNGVPIIPFFFLFFFKDS